MYKLLFFGLLFVFGPSVAQNQKRIRFGPRVGLNTTQLVSSSVGNSSRLIRFSGGLAAEYRMSTRFSLNAELAYAKTGGRYQTAFGTATSYKLVRQFDQIYVPIFLRYHPNASRFFIEAGGQVGYRLSDQISLDDGNSGNVQNFNKVSRIDAGLVLGAGYQLSKRCLLSLRFFKGAIPIYPSYTSTDPMTGIVTRREVVKVTNQLMGLNANFYF